MRKRGFFLKTKKNSVIAVGIGILLSISLVLLIASFYNPNRSSIKTKAQTPSLTAAELKVLIENVKGATAKRYAALDSVGRKMDTAKIIQTSQGGYLAVYHTGNAVHLATSTDLMQWTFKVTLDPNASQPTIKEAPDGSFITASEFNNGGGGKVRLRYYQDLTSLLNGKFAREFTAPRTLSSCNEGTPNIYGITMNPDINNSEIEVGLHYQTVSGGSCNVDREGSGILTNFSQWSAQKEPDLDNALISAAAARGAAVRGNIGDRDSLEINENSYSLFEVQYAKNDFGSWRPFLYDEQTGIAEMLTIQTDRGSTAFANPTFTKITSPSGRPAILVTMFVPVEKAGLLEAGELIYYTEYASSVAPSSGLTPVFHCLGPCPESSQAPTPSFVPQVNPADPPGSVYNSQPCDPSVQTEGNNSSGFVEQFFGFFIRLFMLILELLGGNRTSPPCPPNS